MTSAQPEQGRTRERVGRLARIGLGPVVGLVFVWALFAALRWEKFVTWDNLQIMLLQTSVVGVAAIGATLIIISGGIDLSVGSTIALCTVTTALLLSLGGAGGAQAAPAAQWPLAWPVAAALGSLAAAMGCGFVIGATVVGHVGRVAAALGGLLVAIGVRPFGWLAALAAGVAAAGLLLWLSEKFVRRLALTPFIVTLGMLGLVRGLAEGLADQQMVRAPRTWLNGLLAMGTGPGFSLPPGVWIMLLLALLTAGALRYTRFGRHIFAIGSNELTARLCGVPVERTKILVYTAGVAFAGIAGLLQFSYLSMGDPTTAPGYELNVIAAVVIGGGSLAGGQGSIAGSLIGALIMTMVANGCNKMGLDPWIQKMVTGGIIVAAVALDQARRRRRE